MQSSSFVRVTVAVTLGSAACARSDGAPCIPWPQELRPLAIGGTFQLRAGSIEHESDCVAGSDGPTIRWKSLDQAVARITDGGQVTGVAPGVFRVEAEVGGRTLRAEGFVLPRVWRTRIAPESITVHVGDSVQFRVLAYDSAGGALPPVPFSLFTPEFLRLRDHPSASSLHPLTDKWSHQNVLTPGAFRTERAGTTVITGEIGSQRATARLTVLPSQAR